jgi:prepilin-type N-terminal cleavage/methylation domain-containing protein
VDEPRRADPDPALSARPRRGFSLVEILLTIVIFSVVILSLAGLAFQIARRTTRATDQALSMAVLLAKVDQASTTTFDSLDLVVGCDSTVSGLIRIRGCTTVDSITNVRRRVRIIVSTSLPGTRPDTITFQRGRVRYPIPLR